jgi:hypothetical protein
MYYQITIKRTITGNMTTNPFIPMTETERVHADNCEMVHYSYMCALFQNRDDYKKGDPKGTKEYIYENQKIDSANIVQRFHKSSVRAQSVVKRTKLGMDGLMIQMMYDFGTHNDLDFAIEPSNAIILTAMSNKAWETDLKKKMPSCFANNVFHHGQLRNADLEVRLSIIENGLVIVDEIDTGDKNGQLLHKLLEKCGLLDIDNMVRRNMRFVFVSATMVNELKELEKWGDRHITYYMTIPDAYIGHKEFLEHKIIQEFYEINSVETADKWIKTDIIENYGEDYRIHIIRTDVKNVKHIETSCAKHRVVFRNHTSDKRLTDVQIRDMIDDKSKHHIVIAIKGLYRRANLFPDTFKKRIGTVHERYSKKPDTSVQIQGLTGRMCGYYKDFILNGNHKTGPYRTSVSCIQQYEEFINNPLSRTKYDSNGTLPLFLEPRFIENLDFVEPITEVAADLGTGMVPIIVNCDIKSDEELLIFETTDVKIRKNLIRRKVESIKSENNRYYQLADFITKFDCVQTSKPEIDKYNKKQSSYTRHITDVVSASERNSKFAIDVKEKDKGKNNWQVFLDSKEYRLCFVLWETSNV